MGEATYYLKACGCKDDETFEKVKAFIVEGSKAEDWWQEHRDYETEGSRDEFWVVFSTKFPLVSKYLKSLGLFWGDCNNALAGHLDFGYFDDEYEKIDDHLTCDGDELQFYALVWHFADWDGFSKFLKSEFGLTNVRWLSDEYMNPMDML